MLRIFHYNDPNRPWIFVGGTVMARYRQPGLAVILQDSHARFPGTVRSIDQAKRTCDIMFDDNAGDLVVPFACIDLAPIFCLFAEIRYFRAPAAHFPPFRCSGPKFVIFELTKHIFNLFGALVRNSLFSSS